MSRRAQCSTPAALSAPGSAYKLGSSVRVAAASTVTVRFGSAAICASVNRMSRCFPSLYKRVCTP